MRLFVNSNAPLKFSRRCMCSNNAIDSLIKKNDHKQISKHLQNFFTDESPLKGYEDQNEWATTNQLHGMNSSKANKTPETDSIDPESTSIIVFPGQGNQYVGMGKALMEHSSVLDMFDAASSILHYDLKKLCFEGPKSKLDKTQYCQPATLVCSLAALEELKSTYPLAISNCVATCGFSLGEIAALVFAGCLSFEKAVSITRIRAEAMQTCSKKVSSGLMTVLCGGDSNLNQALTDAKEDCVSKGITDPVCQVANYLFAECKVIGGHDQALSYIESNMKKYKLRKAFRLPVSGAFHTDLMKEAAVPFQKALENIRLNEPMIPVISNVTGKPYRSIRDIKNMLPQQIFKPVKWEQIIHYLYSRSKGSKFPHTYECGPGNSLSVIMKRVNYLAYQNCHKIET